MLAVFLRLADLEVDLFTAYYAAVLCAGRFVATNNVEELHKPISLLDRDLSDSAIWMKHVEDVPFGDPLAG